MFKLRKSKAGSPGIKYKCDSIRWIHDVKLYLYGNISPRKLSINLLVLVCHVCYEEQNKLLNWSSNWNENAKELQTSMTFLKIKCQKTC